MNLILVLATAGVLLCVMSIVLMARTLLRPRRMTDVRALVRLNRMSPADLGLPYESMAFTVHDEETNGRLTLATWWMPLEQSDRTAILIHGYGDAKIGSIAWAPLFRSLGWNVLAVDLRAHGESGGVHTTGGFYERHDIAQLIAEFRRARAGEISITPALRPQLGWRSGPRYGETLPAAGAARGGRYLRLGIRRLPARRRCTW